MEIYRVKSIESYSHLPLPKQPRIKVGDYVRFNWHSKRKVRYWVALKEMGTWYNTSLVKVSQADLVKCRLEGELPR